MSRLLILIALLVVLLVAPSLQVAVEMTQRIAFTRGTDEEQEIYLIDADGSNEYRLTHNHVWDGEVAWSPSGSRLAFVRAIPKREYATLEVGYLAEDEIWVINSDGSAPRLLLSSDLYKSSETFDETRAIWLPEGLIHLHWAPDESQLIFFAYPDNERGREEGVYLLNLTTGEEVQLTKALREMGYRPSPEERYWDRWIEWSPDSREIIYVSDREGNPEIYLMDLATRREQRLTNNQAPDYTPRWSPDGEEIAFVSERDGNPEIYLYLRDDYGGHELRLTNNPEPDLNPRWSPKSVSRTGRSSIRADSICF